MLALLLAIAWSVAFLVGCGTEASTSTAPATATASSLAPASGETAPPVSTVSAAEVWAASLAAVEALGPTRVEMVETTQGRVLGDEVAPDNATFGPQISTAEELLDAANGRAKLTVNESDDLVRTIVVKGRERVTVLDGSSAGASGLVSYGRYVSLEPPTGLPLHLWAGNAVSPTQGYADLLEDTVAGGSEPATTPATTPAMAGGTVEQLENGVHRLSWERSSEEGTSSMSLILDASYLPVRIEIQGEGDLEGVQIEYSSTIDYRFEQQASFADADFALDLPEDYWRTGDTYELSLVRPWSDKADWGQYWLGPQVEDWALVQAEHSLHHDNPDLGAGAEPSEEFVFLLYDRPGAGSDNENIQMMVRPLRGESVEHSRTFAEQRVASGDWVRRELTVAGQPATAYSGALEGGADDWADTIYLFLPDAMIDVQVWAHVDPLVVLEAIHRVE